MKKKLNLASMEAQRLNANEMKNVNGGWAIGFETWSVNFQGWCWCGGRNCSDSTNAVRLGEVDKRGDYSA